MNKEQLIGFEDKIKILWESGKIHCPHHFCGGNEEQLIEYFNKHVCEGDWVFSTHRNAYHWLLHTNDPAFLYRQITKKNNSMHIIDLKKRFISTAIVGGNCAPAVGTAYAIKLKREETRVHCFVGDGACDSGWFWEALRYALGWKLPVTFIIENNNRSVCTDLKTRWGEESFGKSMSGNDEYIYYYEYTPTYPHVGTEKQVRFM